MHVSFGEDNLFPLYHEMDQYNQPPTKSWCIQCPNWSLVFVMLVSCAHHALHNEAILGTGTPMLLSPCIIFILPPDDVAYELFELTHFKKEVTNIQRESLGSFWKEIRHWGHFECLIHYFLLPSSLTPMLQFFSIYIHYH